MRVYVASSTRGAAHHRAIVSALRDASCGVYDWTESVGRFPWAEVGVTGPCDAEALISALAHPTTRRAFRLDANAVAYCDALVLVLPAGRSAHLEAGFVAGQGRPVVVYVPPNEPQEADLMLGWAAAIVGDVGAVVEAVMERRPW
jgi:hypothetical protein